MLVHSPLKPTKKNTNMSAVCYQHFSASRCSRILRDRHQKLVIARQIISHSNNNPTLVIIPAMMYDPRDDCEDEEDIEYGIRQTRRLTSYEYRDSSSLTPAQHMEQEVYYKNAEMAYEQSIILVHMICTLLPLFNRYRTLLQSLLQLHDAADQLVTSLSAYVARLRTTMARLILLLRWVKSYGELALLYAEDLTIFRRRRNRFSPKRFRRLAEINRRDSYSWFGHSPHDIRRLFVAWRIPEHFCDLT
jgi:hypothetical protein